MKVSIYRDEWYPVYTLDEQEDVIGHDIEIPEAIFKNYLRAKMDFRLIQCILEGYYKEAEKPK